MKARRVSQTPIFMISCGSFLGRLIESGPIKSYKIRDEHFVLDEGDWMWWVHIASNVLKNRTEEIQYLTGTN